MKGPGWPSERGWYAIALFAQTLVILAMITWKDDLREDEFFKSIATAIIVTGWIGFAVGMRDNSKDREQVGKAVEAVHEMAKSVPSAPTDVIHDGDTVKVTK